MLDKRPGWYDELKRDPVAAPPRPTPAMLKSIEERVHGRRDTAKRTSLLWASFSCCLLIFVVGGLLWRGGSGGLPAPPAVATVSPGEPPGGWFKPADPKWLMPRDVFERYNSFRQTEDDEDLRDLSPLEVFLIYVQASMDGDRETIYALLSKDDGQEIPARDEFLASSAAQPEELQRTREFWNNLKREHQLTEQIDDSEAVIVMKPPTPAGAQPDPQETKFFRLHKSKQGIWKAGWLAMQ
ncbi:hypothetical protein J31TS4_14220 [Paenibacillus sp. J31TS4]|uniref:hypothetical protein n=1 Tax=Paenibacillus sp. J31TS4 TaxID=2807195 RepID=UPI001AFF1D6D|nr:hypothetical protein [Paenibacillus sp. J31TS4]GIP38142.1 hypothetical protein J31TS4_14220 [Paenibacillus sp. J31TS4]